LPIVSLAREYQFQLSAGNHYIDGDFNVRHPLDPGYLRTGFGGVSRNWDDKRYNLLHGTLGVGSESFVDGLRCDVGFRLLGGGVKVEPKSGTLAAIGFNVSAAYAIPDRLLRIPIDVFGELTWAPNALSFSNLYAYRDLSAGIQFRLIENASLNLGYKYRKFDMNGGWSLSDGIPSLGVGIDF
jgi:opacity protein-like surface antigen